jgi:hypothetical protein
MLKSVDLSVSATVQNTETALVNRRDAGILGVSAEDGKPANPTPGTSSGGSPGTWYSAWTWRP